MEGETAPGLIQARLDRPRLTTDDDRDVTLAEIGVVAEHDDDAQE
jgi:hypothetical protein